VEQWKQCWFYTRIFLFLDFVGASICTVVGQVIIKLAIISLHIELYGTIIMQKKKINFPAAGCHITKVFGFCKLVADRKNFGHFKFRCLGEQH
jgi:hypothetical protein